MPALVCPRTTVRPSTHQSMRRRETLFTRIVVGTDGSDTAAEAVRQASELAQLSNARLDIVSAFEPVPRQRLQEEGRSAPGDVQYEINPREDVNLTLEGATKQA